MNEERFVGFLAVFLGIGCHKGMHGVTGWLSVQRELLEWKIKA